MVRTAETPMDFEWQSRAPMDESSPFAQLGMAHENKKRTHSAFDSPPKKEFPGLRPPNSQPFLFNQPRQPEPPTQPVFSQAAFMTPRKVDVDFSSGAENMSSPENADNEDTPEQPARTERRNSLFNMYGRFAPSPGRGQIPRAPHYSTALFHKVQKRRQRNKALGRRVLVDSDDEDSDRPSSGEGRNKMVKQTQGSSQPQSESLRVSSFSSFFALLEAHPTVPSILSWWAQLAVNILMMGFASWIVWSIVAVIRADFAQAAEEVREKTLAEMAACTKSYLDNRCAADNRLPALHTVCDNWDRCMNQDPDKVGQAQVSAKTMARIINSFIDPISYKSMLFFLASISTITVVSNWSFRTFRSNYFPQDHHPQHPPNYNNYNAQMSHPQPLLSQQNPGLGFYGHQDPRQTPANGYADDENKIPLAIEDSRSMKFVTERSRERENHPRTPSPSKRRFA